MNTELKVGIFTMLGILATVLTIFTLSPDLFDRQKKLGFYTVLKDASGILPKTHVRTNGVTVGQVKSVSLTENATRVEMEVDASVPIPVGSQTIVRTVGFLGDKFIEIKRPMESGGELLEGGYLPQDTTTAEISDVIQVIGGVAKDIKEVTRNLADVLGDKEGRQSISEIVENLRKFSSSLRGLAESSEGDLGKILYDLKDITQSMKSVVDKDNVDRLSRILANFDESMLEVRGASRNINLISEKVEKGEGTIGRLVNDDKALVEIEGAIRELREVISPIRDLEIGVSTHFEVRSQSSNQSYFNVVFKTRPDFYYLLGISDVSERIVNTSSTEVSSEENSDTKQSTKTETIREEDSLRFNAQIAKRWHWIGARIGLFESSGGAALDFYLIDDRFRWAVEVFDFNNSDEPVRRFARVKTYLSALFFDHVYVMFGADDLTRYNSPTDQTINPKIDFYGGVGLTFTDRDLRTVLGAATIGSGF